MTVLTGQYFLNHRLDLNEIEWQMAELAKQGYQGVYPHARQGLLTPYLSEDWWAVIAKIIEVCRRTGMTMWIWDEDYFPSGLAGGRVVWEDPGLISRGLEFTITEVDGAGPFEVDFPQGMLVRAFALPVIGADRYGDPLDVTRFCGTRRQTWSERRVQHSAYSPHINPVGHPHWRCTMLDNRFALAWRPERPGKFVIIAALVRQRAGSVHPDMLNSRSVQRFIELCYEPYYQRFGAAFGTVIQGAFTDEPSPGGWLFPWTPKFPEEFARDHGYDLLPNLPHLARDIDDRSPMVRHHYRLTQHRLQRQNYTEQIARWCREHGIKFCGHLTRTEWLSIDSYYWPNEMRCYQPMDIPAADPLTGTCGWSDAAAYHTGLKVASSVAHLFGKSQAGSDALAVIGDEASLSDLKAMLDYQMVLGINHFVLHGLSYSLDGPRKDEVPPSIFYQHTQWKHMKVLMDHVRTTAEALTGGEHVCDLAVLYPSASLGARISAATQNPNVLPEEKSIHELVETLLGRQKDFDFIDEVTLQEAVTAGGRMTTPEEYRTVILPHLSFIDAATADALLRFVRAGGRVWAIGTLPKAITRDPDSPVREWADRHIVFSQTLDRTLLDQLSGPEVRGEGSRDIFVLRRKKDGQVRSFVFNRRESAFQGTIDGRPVALPPRGSLLLPGPAPEKTRQMELDVSSGWRVTFEANHLPLGFWHVTETPDAWDAPYQVSSPGFDLMARQKDPCGEGSGYVRYVCRFLLTGQVPDARLVMEDAAVAGRWKVSVNGVEIRDWSRAVVFDCRNIQAPVGHALRAGTTPTLNVVVIETEGPDRGLKEVPYLYGSFACEYRYGHGSFPFVKAVPAERELATLQPWNLLGYPTFSGSAVYRRKIEVAADGDYLLDLGTVLDVAAVRVDGTPVKVLAWPPYRCELPNLEQGIHELVVEVTNPPANRNRAARLPAGLLGPVRLLW